MKRALTFLLVLLIAVGGLCYAVDTAIRTLLAAGIQKIQDEKDASLASWEYDSFSRRLVLHDVRYPLPEKSITLTAQEVQATVSLRAALHALPVLDFLLSPQSYLTLLDDWQGTGFSCEQASPNGEQARLTIARLEGAGLAISGEQFKKLRKGSKDPWEVLSHLAVASLLLDEPEMSWTLRQEPSLRLRLDKGVLEKWDTQGRIHSIRLEKCAIQEDNKPAVQLGSLTITSLMTRTLAKLSSLNDAARTWDAFIEDIPFASLAVTDMDMRRPGEMYTLSGFEIARAEEARRLKRLSFQKMLLEGKNAHDTASIRLDECEVRDLTLPNSAQAAELRRAAKDPQLLGHLLASKGPDKPLFSRALFKNLSIQNNDMTIALELLDNSWTQEQDTQTITGTMTNLLVPKSVFLKSSPRPVALPGLKEFRFNASATQTFSGKASHMKGNIVADSLCDLDYSYEMQGKSVLGPWTALRHLDIRLTDKGLMPILACNINKDPAAAQMGMDALTQMVAANLPNGETLLPPLRKFVANPGELKIGITGDEWIPVQTNNPLWLLQAVTRLRIESTPGKSSLADLVKAQLEKAGN